MSRYNYFDDDEENEARENRLAVFLESIGDKIEIRRIARKTVDVIDDVVHSNGVETLREMPNFQALLLKLSAFVLFVIAVFLFILGFSHTISSQNKKNQQYLTDAGKVCTDCILENGTTKWERLDSKAYGKDMAYLTGLSYARQMDFDNDGSDELMLCYYSGGEYILEIWSYVNDTFTKVYGDEANHTKKAKDGSWLSFYHKNNKYYICKSTEDAPEKMELLGLHGDKFKKDSVCEYDYKNDIYTVRKKINAQDFETIKLSVIKTSKAERITDHVSDTIEGFSAVSIAALDSRKSGEQLKNDAYFEVISNKLEKYGKPKVKKENGITYVDGLCHVSLVDFNNDDNEELLLVFRKMIKTNSVDYYSGNSIVIENPTYCVEVYNWNGVVAKKVFSRDSISNYLENRDVNYLMLKTGSKSTQLCFNTYNWDNSYEYTASSRIYRLKKEKFESVFNAKVRYSYGYNEYYLDGDYTYESSFNQEGYKVPMFLNDNGKYDPEKYTVVYVSGKSGVDYKGLVDATNQQIQVINKGYNPNN